MKFNARSTMAAAVAVAIAGCATIMGSPTQLMPISSTPSDATVVITDEKGHEVFKGTTPTSVTLHKSTGSYWGKKNYVVSISKPGFDTQTIPVQASANGWYILGNFVFGGLIGWFIVDPLNGHMYTLSPENVASSLPEQKAAATHNNSATDGRIRIVLVQDVPAELRGKMTRFR